MSWFIDHAGDIGRLALTHLWLALAPLALAFLLALPLGWWAHRKPAVRAGVLGASSVLFTIPSLALFVTLPAVIGTKIISPLNVVIALTVYSTALLVRSVVDALGSVDPAVREAATAMGNTPARTFATVELPLALPVMASGARVAAVSNISLVSVGSIIGVGSLGDLFVDGFNRNFPTEIVIGIVATVLLALVVDGALVLLHRALAPWERPARVRRTPTRPVAGTGR